MNCRKKNYEIGDLVRVRHCWGGYQLPVGLEEGASVRVVAKEVGFICAEREGHKFIVSMACIESGWEYRLDGKWRDESDPAVLAQLAQQCKRVNTSERVTLTR